MVLFVTASCDDPRLDTRLSEAREQELDPIAQLLRPLIDSGEPLVVGGEASVHALETFEHL